MKIAREYGATDIVSYKEGGVVRQIRTLTGGGADKVIVAGGNQDTLRQAVEMTRPMGTVVSINFYDVTDTLSMPAMSWGLGMSNVDIRCGFCPGGAVRVERMMELIRHGRIDTTKLITHRFHGFDQIEDALLLMDRKDADLIKPVVFVN